MHIVGAEYLGVFLEALAASLVAWRFRALRRDMAFGALLALPVLLIEPLASGDLVQALAVGGMAALLSRLAMVVSLASLLVAAYKAFLHPILTPVVHPRRGTLAWLWLGPAIALVLFGIAGRPLVASVGIALAVDLVAVLALGANLIWDMLASAAGMAGLYLVLYLLLGQYLDSYAAFGSGSFSGITLLGLPIEELALVAVFGALWGPLYSAARIPLATQDFKRHHLLPKQLAVTAVVLAIGGGYYALDVTFMRAPQVAQAAPAAGDTIDSLTSPFTISFDRPIDQKSVSVTVTPPVEGDLSFSNSYFERYFVRSLTFAPRTYFQPDTLYKVQVSGLGNVLGRKDGTYRYSFRTAALPTVTAASVQADQQDVAICDPLTLRLNQPAGSLAKFTFSLVPEVPLAVTPGASSYTLKPASCLSQSAAYTLTAQRQLTVKGADGSLLGTDDPADVYSVSFTTKGAPGIASFTPQGGGVLVGTRTLTVGFSEPMATGDPSSYLAISPAVKGSWSWKDPQTLAFAASEDLKLDTSYQVVVRKGLPDQKQGFLPEDATYSFSTPGAVRVSGISPANGAGGVSSSASIKVTFDQPVDHASAQAAFLITPSADGSFSWSGQTMIYSATLQKDSRYAVTEGAGVISQIGLPSASSASSSFTTQASTTLLSIPLYYQQRALSCEAASLTMALRYRGVSIGESSILNDLGDYPQPRSGNIWGDPNQVFVGDVNGRQNTTGYGVYPAPIARVASQYRQAQAFQGWTVSQLASALAAGNPVVFWGVASKARPDSWYTPAGAYIPAWVEEHVRTVVGFTGPVSNPTGFIINDPIFGRLQWTTAQFKSNWATFGNEGVVVY